MAQSMDAAAAKESRAKQSSLLLTIAYVARRFGVDGDTQIVFTPNCTRRNIPKTYPQQQAICPKSSSKAVALFGLPLAR